MGRREDALGDYHRKRDFHRTREPRGGRTSAASAPLFVVQRHDARRLHYDLRLEIDGVLKSWAVPKGPSLDPDTKRLAVPTEDHPLEYADFEGEIPKGEYGGGTVLLWDRGTYRARGDASKGYADGKLVVELEGERLRGGFTLVRTGDAAWLLRKRRDAFAEGGGEEEHEEAAPAPLPRNFTPALATPAKSAPPGVDYLHEIKLDGYRMLARVEHGRRGGDVLLSTRSGLDWTHKLPAIAEAARALPDGIYDGEAVVYGPEGTTDFGALVEALHGRSDDPIVLVLFDAPFCDGRDLRDEPLERRKAKLASVLRAVEGGPIAYCDHVVGRGPDFLELVLGRGLEGILSKKIDSPYRSGRTRDWLKVRGAQRQEFIVVGYTPLVGSKSQIGALLLATREGGGLRYAGKVGTGFDDATRKRLAEELRALAQPKSPLDFEEDDLPKDAHWARPTLVAEVRFREWTAHGRLRHPSFLGLREDKPVQEIVREVVVEPSKPDKVLYPAPGITKLDLALYYARVAPRMMPHVVDRPLMLLRAPHGVEGTRWYQKHPTGTPPEGFDRVAIEEKDGPEDYLVVRAPEGLAGLAQLAALEAHIWGSRVDSVERPDRLVFDLDPAPDVAFEAVIALALVLRERLSPLESFAMVTGGKGVHVVVPIERRVDFERARGFTAAVAQAFARESPEWVVAKMSKAARRGRIFIDYLRNGRGATAVCPYSTRANPEAAVAMPVGWDELEGLPSAATFTVADAEARMRADDPWRDYGSVRQRLSAKIIDEAERRAGR